MFDSCFNFSLIQKKPSQEKFILFEHVYHFKTSKRRYIVIVEEYHLNIFVVKFYPADKKRYNDRFSIVLNDFDFAPIIRTCINIMLEVLKENPTASFGYVGANSVTKTYKEGKRDTQRYRIYQRVMDIFLSPLLFARVESAANSAELLLNRKNENLQNLRFEATKMFVEIYPDLENDLYQ